MNPVEQQAVCLYGRAISQARELDIQRWFLNWWKLENHILVHAIAVGSVGT